MHRRTGGFVEGVLIGIVCGICAGLVGSNLFGEEWGWGWNPNTLGFNVLFLLFLVLNYFAIRDRLWLRRLPGIGFTYAGFWGLLLMQPHWGYA